jgi:hypothetical protein
MHDLYPPSFSLWAVQILRQVRLKAPPEMLHLLVVDKVANPALQVSLEWKRRTMWNLTYFRSSSRSSFRIVLQKTWMLWSGVSSILLKVKLSVSMRLNSSPSLLLTRSFGCWEYSRGLVRPDWISSGPSCFNQRILRLCE